MEFLAGRPDTLWNEAALLAESTISDMYEGSAPTPPILAHTSIQNLQTSACRLAHG